MADARTYSIELAFRRLRFGVLGCCWIVGLALTAQLVIWSLARFTDMRFETHIAAAPPAQVITAEQQPDVGRLRPAAPTNTGEVATVDVVAVDPNHVYSTYDEYFRQGSTLAGALGKLGYMMLMPLLAVGVFLSAGSATAGVHKTVSAFTWSLVLAVLMLPVGSIVNWPALAGAFYDYDAMVAGVEASQQTLRDAGTQSPPGGMLFAQYLMLPVVCLVSTILIGFRFSLGVEASLLHQETRQFDPILERETSNRSATSLHAGGGRSSGALTRVITPSSTPAPSSPAVAKINGSPDDRMPGATKVAAGEAPRRLI